MTSLPILLVEDSEDDVFFMKSAFKKAEIANPVYIAEDGERAVELLHEARGSPAQRPPPCLVILDLKLPRLPGLEVLKWIREQPDYRTLPVIIFTSSQDERDVQAAFSRGANSYFSKPSDTASLARLVSLIKTYWLELSILPRSSPEWL